MPAVQLVAEAAARGGRVDRGAVKDQSDGLGAARERTADDLFAFALGLRQHATECLVDKAEGERQRQLGNTDQLGPWLDDLICAGQPALESNLMAAPITLIDSVQVDAAAHDGTGGVKCLGWDRIR